MPISVRKGADGPQSFAEAMQWWRKAAEEGSADGAFNVAIMYLEGEVSPSTTRKPCDGFAAQPTKAAHKLLRDSDQWR
jgi:TPR repeat protein